MYQALLTKKYLTSKLMPILAMLAVMLSVATILITWSVMGGFLKTLVNSGRSLIGDVTITWPNVGFAHYDELIEMLEADPMIKGATPVIETFGLIQLPDDRIELITIKGIDPQSYNRVTNYEDTIWWKPIDEPTAKDRDGSDIRLDEQFTGAMEMFESNAMSLTRLNTESGITEQAGVLGVEVTGLNIRTPDGIYDPRAYGIRATPDGGIERVPGFMPTGDPIGLTVLSLDSTGKPVNPVTRTIPIANEFQSGIFEIDQSTIFVPLGVMQEMLRLNEARKVEMVENPFATEIDPVTGQRRPKLSEVIGIDPARVTTVLVR
ncbi:MAG: hypothetical protein P1U30_09285, partial [Phycisphaerales bacterium]|nr:hypothetical protein [Phycisphaerales bacterium]